MERFVLRGSRWQAALCAFAAGILLVLEWQGDRNEAAGVLVERHWAVLAAPAGHVLTLVGAGIGFLVACLYLITRRDDVILGPEGILARDHSSVVIPWSAIEAAWPIGADILCLKLRDPARYPVRGWRHWTIGRKLDGADVMLRLTHAKGRFEELLSVVETQRPGLLRDL